ncbi:hypothetical protein N9C04_03435 [Planktomarina temperata]|nr:hypothetical protein [Planktomarina temperata]
MNKHQEFLKFEAVLAYCEKHVPENSLLAAMDYGREMKFFDRQNSLSASGQLLAEMLMPKIDDPSFVSWSLLQSVAYIGVY